MAEYVHLYQTNAVSEPKEKMTQHLDNKDDPKITPILLFPLFFLRTLQQNVDRS